MIDVENKTDREFKVGDGATYMVGSDRYAGTIVEVSKTGHRVVWQFDRATLVSSTHFNECQEWAFERDPDARTVVFTRRKDGRYAEAGAHYRGRPWLSAGRTAYRDPGF